MATPSKDIYPCVETLHDAPERLDEGEDKVQTTM